MIAFAVVMLESAGSLGIPVSVRSQRVGIAG